MARSAAREIEGESGSWAYGWKDADDFSLTSAAKASGKDQDAAPGAVSEEQFHRELQDAWIECRLHLSVGRRAQVRAHGGETRLAGRRNRSHEIRVIEHVESLRPDL